MDIKKEFYVLCVVFFGGVGDAAMYFFLVIFGIFDDLDKINVKWNSMMLNELFSDVFVVDNLGEFFEC